MERESVRKLEREREGKFGERERTREGLLEREREI